MTAVAIKQPKSDLRLVHGIIGSLSGPNIEIAGRQPRLLISKRNNTNKWKLKQLVCSTKSKLNSQLCTDT